MEFIIIGIGGVTYEERDGLIYGIDDELPTYIQNDVDVTRFIEGLSLCHTVQLDYSSKDVYNASSPDELSFIKFCSK